MAIEQVGIVGAGQMGNGIAHVFALAGYDVLMTDISEDALRAAIALIDKNLERQVSKEIITTRDKAEAMSRIHTTATLIELGQTDLIIEAATEKEPIKTAILKMFHRFLAHLKHL